MQPPFLLAVDMGTTSTKASLFDTEGRIASEARVPVQAEHPRPGFAELDAEVWWDTFCQSVRQAVAGKAQGVAALAITHQRQSFVPVDKAMRPLRRAILWYDSRASAEAEQARARVTAGRIYARTGSPPGRRAIYKVMWLAAHEPEMFAQIFKILFIPDLLIYRLTGELVTAQGTAATSGCLDIAHPESWAEDILTELGIAPDIWVTPILRGGMVAGPISAPAARSTGLVAGTPVILAAGDQPCGNLGCGVARPGMMGINGGTSCALEMPTAHLVLDPEAGHFVDFSPAGFYLAENGITSGGAALFDWYRDEFIPAPERHQPDMYQRIHSELIEGTPPGNLGLLLVPYLRGANGPFWDSRARGLLAGLRLDHGRAHLARALLEGLAYEARRIMETMESASGEYVDDIRMYGGSSKSKQWNQTFADVLNRPVRVTALDEPPALGAAIAAGVGVGIYQDMRQAAGAMVQVRQTFEPRPECTALYERLYGEVYRHLYAAVADLMGRASAIVGYP